MTDSQIIGLIVLIFSIVGVVTLIICVRIEIAKDCVIAAIKQLKKDP